MRFDMIIAFAAMPVAYSCAALPQSSSETNAVVEVVETVSAETNAVADVWMTNAVVDVVATNAMPGSVDNLDDTSDDFSIEDWAEELAEEAEQGVHVKKGYVLVVAHLEPIDGEYLSLTKLRAKVRAIELLRCHYQNLPMEFSAPCRVIVCEQSDVDDHWVVVILFLLKDLWN